MSAENNFQYAMVANGIKPLAEYAILDGNHRKIAVKMLENLDPKTPRAIIEQGNYVFMTLTDPDKTTYLCLTSKNVSPQARISFLQDLQRKWRSKYGNGGASFPPNSKDNEFGKTEIAALIRNFNSERNQKLTTIKENIAQAQEQMTQNLTMAFARGEQLEVMEKKAENIQNSSSTFHREATNVRKKMCFQKWKWYLLIFIIIVVVILVIILIACKGFKC
ncbi:Synaptobrevin family protein [Histomonas meleagridis]|uniref:Synaptobrevin family protein n=1 Tax=Histomonas meleagridis TaxID=135588 RepID=UPI00355A524A|nr:Synaptobrevin family protein [Histomonas meleagridis]KAH0796205.1 Synaptobrevin family protein [Histomonas meleagridis]